MRSVQTILLVLFVIVVVAILGFFFFPSLVNAPGVGGLFSPSPKADSTSPFSNEIQVNLPKPNSVVSSPLKVAGMALGTWYFEAGFPIELLDNQGSVIGQEEALAQGDWTTTNFVPFTASLSFPPQHAGNHGTLVFKNDNPSGDPANQKEVDIPVTF